MPSVMAVAVGLVMSPGFEDNLKQPHDHNHFNNLDDGVFPVHDGRFESKNLAEECLLYFLLGRRRAEVERRDFLGTDQKNFSTGNALCDLPSNGNEGFL
jgi:hypothetical protein